MYKNSKRTFYEPNKLEGFLRNVKLQLLFATKDETRNISKYCPTMFSKLVSFPLHNVEVRGQESGDVTGELRSLKISLARLWL